MSIVNCFTRTLFFLSMFFWFGNIVVALDFQEGMRIALQSSNDSPGKGKFLRVEDGKYLKATGTDQNDPACQFVVMRHGQWTGLKSLTSGGNNLQSVPSGSGPESYVARFENKNFNDDGHTWEHFVVEGSMDGAFFKNEVTGGYLSVRSNDESWAGGKVFTCDHTGSPAKPLSWEKLTVHVVGKMSGQALYRNDSIASFGTVNSDVFAGRSWQLIDGGLIQITSNNRFDVWGVSADNGIWYREGVSASNQAGTSWTRIDGASFQIAVNDKNELWCIGTDNGIWRRVGITDSNRKGTGWERIDGAQRFIHIAMNNKGNIWALGNSLQPSDNDAITQQFGASWVSDRIFFRQGVSAANPRGSAWQEVGGLLMWLEVSDTNVLWGVNRGGGIFIRTGMSDANPIGTDWQNIDGGLTCVSVNNDGILVGVNSADNIYQRMGTSVSNPVGSSWTQQPGALTNISINSRNQVYGVNRAGNIYYLAGGTLLNPSGVQAQNVVPPPIKAPDALLASASTQAPVNIPTSLFNADGNNAISIGVGSRNGELFAATIKNDGMLYTYNQYSLAADPWTKMNAQDASGVPITPLDSVSVSSDGALWVLNKAGVIYNYNWITNAFQAVPAGANNGSVKFNAISVGNSYEIWAVDSNNNIYRYATTGAETGTGWTLITQGVAVDVAVGADSTVMAVNTAGQVFTYAGGGQWRRMQTVTLDSIAVANAGQAWGTMQGSLWQYNNGAWQQVNDASGKPVMGVHSIAANAANTLMLVDQNGGIWCKGDSGVTVVAAPSLAVLTAAIANAMPSATATQAVATTDPLTGAPVLGVAPQADLVPPSATTAVQTQVAPSKKASRAALRKQGKIPAAKTAAAPGKKAARRTDAAKSALHKKAAQNKTAKTAKTPGVKTAKTPGVKTAVKPVGAKVPAMATKVASGAYASKQPVMGQKVASGVKSSKPAKQPRMKKAAVAGV